MSSSVPERIHMQEVFDQFWSQLTWEKLERRIREALRYPGRAVPREINCPAVMDLAKQVMGGIGELAIQRQGAVVSPREEFTLDQRVAVMRLLEAIISEYEDWKKVHSTERETAALRSALRTDLSSLEQK